MSHSSAIKQIKGFDHRVNLLWDRVKDDYVVVVPRTEKFLNWRFTEHPTIEYSKFISENSGDENAYYKLAKQLAKATQVLADQANKDLDQQTSQLRQKQASGVDPKEYAEMFNNSITTLALCVATYTTADIAIAWQCYGDFHSGG